VNLAQSTVAITGATGFLGGYLVDALIARGARVVAVVRNPEKARSLAERGCDVRRADLADRDALTRAFTGCDAIISNAAVVAFTRPTATHETNVGGTRNVFEAAASQGVKRAIVISSAAAYRASPLVRDEQSRLRQPSRWAPWAAYGASKAESERVAAEICVRHAIALTTFRPCGISGAGDPLLMGALEVLGRFKVAPLPIFTAIGVVHAADVAEAVVLALENTRISRGKAYNLQGDTASLWAVVRAYARAGGKAPRLAIPVPFPFLLRYDDQRIREELGWSPRHLQAICEDAVSGSRANVSSAVREHADGVSGKLG
jgi:nucleoside-diphosphate-sugar epimerase